MCDKEELLYIKRISDTLRYAMIKIKCQKYYIKTTPE